MASCDVQSLIDDAAGFDGLEPGEKRTAELQLLNLIAGSPPLSTTISESFAFDGLEPGEKSTVELQLLCTWRGQL